MTTDDLSVVRMLVSNLNDAGVSGAAAQSSLIRRAPEMLAEIDRLRALVLDLGGDPEPHSRRAPIY